MAEELTHRPQVLYLASIQRMNESEMALRQHQWVLAFYLAGLSVECILQAVAIRAGAAHDAKHDLSKWLSKCPTVLQNTLNLSDYREHWSAVCANWTNRIRYFSDDALLGYCRQKDLLRGWSGDNRARIIQVVKSFIKSASVVQKKGLSTWHYNK